MRGARGLKGPWPADTPGRGFRVAKLYAAAAITVHPQLSYFVVSASTAISSVAAKITTGGHGTM